MRHHGRLSALTAILNLSLPVDVIHPSPDMAKEFVPAGNTRPPCACSRAQNCAQDRTRGTSARRGTRSRSSAACDCIRPGARRSCRLSPCSSPGCRNRPASSRPWRVCLGRDGPLRAAPSRRAEHGRIVDVPPRADRALFPTLPPQVWAPPWPSFGSLAEKSANKLSTAHVRSRGCTCRKSYAIRRACSAGFARGRWRAAFPYVAGLSVPIPKKVGIL